MLDVGVERQHDRRIVRGGIGVREAAAERAAIAHLRIANRRRRFGQHRTGLLHERRGGDVVMDGPGADLRSCRPSV